MKLKTSYFAGTFSLVLLLMLSNKVIAQTNQDSLESELFKTIAAMDSVLFYAFNTCDVNTSKSVFTEDLEFYHDAGGLTNYAQNARSIEQRCGRQTKVRRELVNGSLEVFPIKDFGAIQTGSHCFYYTEKEQEEKLDGTFKFIHIWKNINGNWKIARVVSYDH